MFLFIHEIREKVGNSTGDLDLFRAGVNRRRRRR